MSIGSQSESDGGFVLADALTALSILSTTIALGLGTASVAHKISHAVAETREARVSLAYLMDRPMPEMRDDTSMDGQFRWRLSLNPTGQSRFGGAASLCDRTAEVTSLVSHKTYKATRLQVCPPKPGT
jgi:hypothetical protein